MYHPNSSQNTRVPPRNFPDPMSLVYGERQHNSSILTNFMKDGHAAAGGRHWGKPPKGAPPNSMLSYEEYGHPPSEFQWPARFPSYGNQRFYQNFNNPMDSVARELQQRSFPSGRPGGFGPPLRGWKNFDSQQNFPKPPNLVPMAATKHNKSIEEIMKEKIRNCFGILEQVNLQISLSNAIGQKSSEASTKDEEAKAASHKLKTFNESLQNELSPLKKLICSMTNLDHTSSIESRDVEANIEPTEPTSEDATDELSQCKNIIAKLRCEIRTLKATLGDQNNKNVLENCTQTEQRKHNCIKIQKELDFVIKKVWKLQNSLKSLREKTAQMEELHHKINHELISKVFAYKKLQQDFDIANKNLEVLESYVKSKEFVNKAYSDADFSEIKHQYELTKCHMKCLYNKYDQNKTVMDQLKYQVFGILKSLDSPHRLNFQKFQSNFFEMWKVGHLYPIICKCPVSDCLCKPPSPLSVDLLAEKSLFYCTPVTELWRDGDHYNGTTLLVETDYEPRSKVKSRTVPCKGTLYSDHIDCCGSTNVDDIVKKSVKLEKSPGLKVDMKFPFGVNKSQDDTKDEDESFKQYKSKDHTEDETEKDLDSALDSRTEIIHSSMIEPSCDTKNHHDLIDMSPTDIPLMKFDCPEMKNFDSESLEVAADSSGSLELQDEDEEPAKTELEHKASDSGNSSTQTVRCSSPESVDTKKVSPRKHSSSEGDAVSSLTTPEAVLINIPYAVKEDQLKEVLTEIGECICSDFIPMSKCGGKWRVNVTFKNPRDTLTLLRKECINVSGCRIPVIGSKEFDSRFNRESPKKLLNVSLDDIFFNKSKDATQSPDNLTDPILVPEKKDCSKDEVVEHAEDEKTSLKLDFAYLESIFPRVSGADLKQHCKIIQLRYGRKLADQTFNTIVKDVYSDRLYTTGVEETTSCLLCCQSYGNEETAVISCYHCFHYNCLKGWSLVMKDCPSCEKKIEPIS